MAIPLPEKYMRPEGGIGKLANYQAVQADTLVAAEAIPYGAPVQATEGEARKFQNSFFGVAIADNYVNEISFDGKDKVGEHAAYKPVAVLRKGSIWVKVTADVKENEDATVTAAGFKEAGADDAVVGSFQSSAQANGLAILQINLPAAVKIVKQEGGQANG